MASVIGGGSGKAAAAQQAQLGLAQQQAEEAQRRTLAQIAQQNAEIDMARTAGGGGRAGRGRALLSYLDPGQKQTFG